MPVSQKEGKTARRTWVWRAVLVCWCLFMWSRSLKAGDASLGDSSFVVRLVRPLFEAVGVTDADLMQFVVRKLAHFTEYLVMGLVCRQAFPVGRGPRGRRAAFAARALTVVLVPSADECIQLFVPGRSGMARDVLIDMAGAVSGLALSGWTSRLRSRRARRS